MPLAGWANLSTLTLMGEGEPQQGFTAEALLRSWAQDGISLSNGLDQSEGLVIWWNRTLKATDLATVEQVARAQTLPIVLLVSADEYNAAGNDGLRQWLKATGWDDLSGRQAAEAGQVDAGEQALRRVESLGVWVAVAPNRVLVLLDKQPVESLTTAPLTMPDPAQPMPPASDSEVVADMRGATFAKRVLQWLEQARQLFAQQRMARAALVKKYLTELDLARSLFWEDAEVTQKLESTLLKPAKGQASRMTLGLLSLAKADKLRDQLSQQGDNPDIPEETLTLNFQQAKGFYQQAWQQVTPPVSPVQARALWLDRGAIVKAGSPEGLKQLLAQYKGLGIQDIFFETINAGFPMYDSSVLPLKNPLIQGWDPLATAVTEGHRLGMRVHAWVWCFAVGNRRHNPLIGERDEYPGPILAQAGLGSETLRFTPSPLGSLYRQEEFWLTPASLNGQGYLLKAYEEIVTRYPVDGLHLDYIRWPFQKSNWLAGVDRASLTRYYEDITPPAPEWPGPMPVFTPVPPMGPETTTVTSESLAKILRPTAPATQATKPAVSAKKTPPSASAKPKPPELTPEQQAELKNWQQRKALWEAYQLRIKRQQEAIAKGAIPDNKAQWQRWKADQVSHFVETLSTRLKSQRPDLILSAAVFALPRANRLAAIQQDWERWLQAGWLDWLTPMTYTDQVSELKQQVNYLYSQTEATGSLLLPGLGLHKLDDPTLSLELRALQQKGVAGSTMFAASQLTPDRMRLLQGNVYQLPVQVPGKEANTTKMGRDWMVQQVAVLRSLLGPTAESGLSELTQATPQWMSANWKPMYERTRQWIWDTYGYQPFWTNYLMGELQRLNLLVRYVQRHEMTAGDMLQTSGQPSGTYQH